MCFTPSGGDGVIQHDLANYGDSFVVGRANLSYVKQFFVTDSSSRNVSRTQYDTHGNMRQSLDTAGHTVTYNLTDYMTNKATGVGPTNAMVREVTDPDTYRNGAQYNWYNGLPVKSFHLKAMGGAEENIVTYGYETADRLNQVINPDGGGMIRAYWDNWLAVATYTKIDATQTRYEAVSYDGSGNMNSRAGDHPDATAGKYSYQKYAYDTVGRSSQVSNVTAVNGSYLPIDDDAALGFQYTGSTFDVFDRPLVVALPDANTMNYSYTGCGCAGSATTTITDQRGKKRKQTYDPYGRLAEACELDAGSAVYSKAVYNYDTRDLLQDIKHYNGGTAYQQRSFVYDGYARVLNQTTPEEGLVSYTYDADDLVSAVTNQKAVGNTTTFAYNNRHQVTGVSYNDANATPTVSHAYDEYGGRTSMTANGVSTTAYGYNSYHQLTSENVTFNGLAGNYQLDYSYNYVGAPTSVRYTTGAWVRGEL